MTPEAQRIAIAETCGFIEIGTNTDLGRKYNETVVTIPDYLNDLNAMHEVEKMLDVNIQDKGSKRYIYAEFLYNLCDDIQQPCRATAAQRAEAFLRTLNLWKEQGKNE